MHYLYSPPKSELYEPATSRPSWGARLFAVLLGCGAVLAWLVAGLSLS